MHTYVDLNKLLVVTIGVENVIGEIGETPFETLKKEKDEETNERENSTKRQIQALNETLIKKIKGFSGKEIIPSRSLESSSVCQLYNMVGHGVSTCSKLSEKKLCGKCKGGHRKKMCGFNCSYYFGS